MVGLAKRFAAARLRFAERWTPIAREVCILLGVILMDPDRAPNRRRALAALAAIILVGLPGWPSAQTPESDAKTTPELTPLPPAFKDSTWIEMRNVLLHIDDRGVIRIERLRGQVVTDGGKPAVLDDAKSFTIRVTRGTTRPT